MLSTFHALQISPFRVLMSSFTACISYKGQETVAVHHLSRTKSKSWWESSSNHTVHYDVAVVITAPDPTISGRLSVLGPTPPTDCRLHWFLLTVTSILELTRHVLLVHLQSQLEISDISSILLDHLSSPVARQTSSVTYFSSFPNLQGISGKHPSPDSWFLSLRLHLPLFYFL